MSQKAQIRVQAIRMGYRGVERVKPATVFFLDSEKEFSKLWMRKLQPGEIPPPVEQDRALIPGPSGGATGGFVI